MSLVGPKEQTDQVGRGPVPVRSWQHFRFIIPTEERHPGRGSLGTSGTWDPALWVYDATDYTGTTML